MNRKFLLSFVFLIFASSIVDCQLAINTLLTFLNRGGKIWDKELPNKTQLRQKYDFIIVGAGSAGCILANRLSENPDWNILLIEAGGNENLFMDIPMMVHYLQGYNVNWKYKTERSESSCLAMENNQCHWPRGKVMGGSSVLNYMVYTRGNSRDYDNWARMGNPGWDFQNVSHYFRKLENNIADGITPNYHGKGGPVTISNIKYKSPASQAFLQSGVEQGFRLADYNGPRPIGFSFLQATIANASRQSTNVAYLYPISSRKNLHVKKYSQVTKLLIDCNKKVYGVEFVSKGKTSVARASKEVILSAGAINTPQLLMLSGIGPKNHLNQFGIETVANLAVGYNLMDHIAPGALTFLVNSTSYRIDDLMNLNLIKDYVFQMAGPIGSAGAVEALAFIDTLNPRNHLSVPDIEYMFIGASINIDPVLKRNFALRDDVYDDVLKVAKPSSNAFMVFPMILRPKSRGRIKLRSRNPFDHPMIYPNYYSDRDDVATTVRGIRLLKKLVNSKSFKKIDAKFAKFPLKGCTKFKYDSDAYWECYMRHFTFTIYHHCGTAKMGPSTDRHAVVDPTLKVIGIKGLRVVDASVMPEIISGHTNGPVIMIAEKASDMIKQEWNSKLNTKFKLKVVNG